jgi:hypothetical protein
MAKFYLLLLFCCSTLCVFSQRRQKFRGYITFQYTKTLEDLTRGNNPWGMGTGFQLYWHLTGIFQPVADVTGDLYLEDDKVLRGAGVSGERLPTVRAISKVLIGPSLNIGRYINASVVAGPSFTGGDAYFTVKPSLQIFLNKRQSVFVKASHIHVDNRGLVTTGDFISYSLGLGFKVF